MTASSSGVTRREVVIWVTVCLLANQAISFLDMRTFTSTLDSLATQNLFYWLACFVILYRLSSSDGARPASLPDLTFSVATCLAILMSNVLAHRFASGFFATTAAAYLLSTHAGDRHLKSAAIVLLALSLHLVWGPVFFLLTTPELLRADATLVGGLLKLLRPEIIWNDTSFQTLDGHAIALIGACSSFHNISSAALACVTVAMLMRPDWNRRDAATAAVATVAMIGLNVARLCLMATSRDGYLYWHHGSGAIILANVFTVVILGIAWRGAKTSGRSDHKADPRSVAA